MITLRKLGEFIAAEPFRAFRIRLSDGRALDIAHHESISVSRDFAVIQPETDGLAGTWERVPLAGIRAAEVRV